MRILLAHNYYRRPSGEDVSYRTEQAILKGAGHRVILYERHNAEIAEHSLMQNGALLLRTVWAANSRRAIGETVRQERPQVAHFHNTFPLISPSVYSACREANVPTVQTLRNYRLLCPNALLHRGGRTCEDCLGRTLPWPSVVHACYRNSRAQTAVVAAMLTLHHWLKTWQELVDVYIALTEFSRRKFIQGGLPEDKIVVKPNFVHPDPGVRERGKGDYALFVGRLSAEKGVRTLLMAWRSLQNIPLRIVGDGPLMNEAAVIVERSRLEGVDLLGRRPSREVVTLMKRARLLVFPSEWYETFGRVAVEAFACGVPVIASRLGAMAEIVEDGRTGLHFAPAEPDDLASKVAWLWSHPTAAGNMGREARAEFEAKYTAETNYQMLMKIYETLLASSY